MVREQELIEQAATTSLVTLSPELLSCYAAADFVLGALAVFVLTLPPGNAVLVDLTYHAPILHCS